MIQPNGFIKKPFVDRRQYCEDDEALICSRHADFVQQCERMDKFMEDVAPLMDYVRAEIKRNDRRSEMYSKITEHVLGATVLSIFGTIGYWALSKLKKDIWG